MLKTNIVGATRATPKAFKKLTLRCCIFGKNSKMFYIMRVSVAGGSKHSTVLKVTAFGFFAEKPEFSCSDSVL